MNTETYTVLGYKSKTNFFLGFNELIFHISKIGIKTYDKEKK